MNYYFTGMLILGFVFLALCMKPFQADLLKKSEQKPTDQEQFMLIESLYGDVEKLTETQEQNMTNKVNIEFLKSQLEKALTDIEHLKDKVRANGNNY